MSVFVITWEITDFLRNAAEMAAKKMEVKFDGKKYESMAEGIYGCAGKKGNAYSFFSGYTVDRTYGRLTGS